MKAEPLSPQGLVRIVPRRLHDHRGYFCETFKDAWFRDTVANLGFAQENLSHSHAPGTLRGLHFQIDPFAQGKLVHCLAGAIFDVAVDIREGSPTFGHWHGLELSAENGEQFWIPAGFAHGFVTLQPDTVVHYKVTAPYCAAHDRGIRWTIRRSGLYGR